MLDNGKNPLKRSRGGNSNQEGVLASSALIPAPDPDVLSRSPKRAALSAPTSFESPRVIKAMTRIGEKESGKSSQGFIGQSPTKHRPYVVKIGPKVNSAPLHPGQIRSNAFSRETSDVLCEYIFALAYKRYLGDKVPDIRLFVDKQDRLCLASRKFDFITLKELGYSQTKKPENLEHLFAVAGMLGNDDCHSENVSDDGKMVDGGRSAGLQATNAQWFVCVLECLFHARFRKFGYDLDYQKLKDAFALIQQVNKDEIVETIKLQIATLKEQMPNKDLREIKFLNITVNKKIETMEQLFYCSRSATIASWEALENKLTGFINKQFSMLPEVLEILNNRTLAAQEAALAQQQAHYAATLIESDSEEEEVATLAHTVADALSHQGSQPRRSSFGFAVAAPLAGAMSSSTSVSSEGEEVSIAIPDDVRNIVSNSLRSRESQRSRTLVRPV